MDQGKKQVEIKGATKHEMDRCLKNQSKKEVSTRLKGNAPFLIIATGLIVAVILLSKLFG